MVKKLLVISAFLFSISIISLAQNSTVNENKYTPTGNFRTSRMIYGHSAQTSNAGVLDLRISHRFGRLSEGFQEWFGLDSAFVRIGVDYGITDRLMVGLGRSKLDKEFDLNAAYKILNQAEGGMPLTLTLYGAFTLSSAKRSNGKFDFNDNMGSVVQLLMARTFGDRFTIQVAPIWVYNGMVYDIDDSHHIFSVGLGGRLRMFKNVSLNVEYYPLFSGAKLTGTTSPLAIGVDIDTRGHTFQLFVGNSMSPNEHLMFIHTTDKWTKGHIHFGFNLVRRFRVATQK